MAFPKTPQTREAEILGNLVVITSPTATCRQFGVTFVLPLTDTPSSRQAVMDYLRNEWLPKDFPLVEL